MVERLVSALRRANDVLAVVTGAALLATVAFILADICLRQLGASFGGTDEISGYVMAGATSWGMGYALLTLAHVRIDLARMKLLPMGRALADVLAASILTATTLVIAVQTWPVLSKTIAAGSQANTPLETPLWIPQVIWWSGWLWFAFSASALLLCALSHLCRRDAPAVDAIIGVRPEVEEAQ